MQIRLLAPTIGQTMQKIFMQLCHTNFSVSFSPGTKSKYSLRPIKRAMYIINFNLQGLLILQHIARFRFDVELAVKTYAAAPKIVASVVKGFVPSTSTDSKPNWRNAYPHKSVRRYYTFASIPRVPDTARFILKLRTNNEKYSGSQFSNKAIFNS